MDKREAKAMLTSKLGEYRTWSYEHVVPPDGSNDSPYHIRDIGTIFFVIASLSLLDCMNGK